MPARTRRPPPPMRQQHVARGEQDLEPDVEVEQVAGQERVAHARRQHEIRRLEDRHRLALVAVADALADRRRPARRADTIDETTSISADSRSTTSAMPRVPCRPPPQPRRRAPACRPGRRATRRRARPRRPRSATTRAIARCNRGRRPAINVAPRRPVGISTGSGISAPACSHRDPSCPGSARGRRARSMSVAVVGARRPIRRRGPASLRRRLRTPWRPPGRRRLPPAVVNWYDRYASANTNAATPMAMTIAVRIMRLRQRVGRVVSPSLMRPTDRRVARRAADGRGSAGWSRCRAARAPATPGSDCARAAGRRLRW